MSVRKRDPSDVIVALVGCPNVGKSTLFNALTGLKQHTGNWPGKTVEIEQGRYRYKGKTYILVDLPGTYSLVSQSKEEQVTVEFIQSGQADCALVVADATALERTMLPALQLMELTSSMALCVNLMDEAVRNHIGVDTNALCRELGVPVVGTSAGDQGSLNGLKEMIRNFTDGFLAVHPRKVSLPAGRSIIDWKQGSGDLISKAYSEHAEHIANAVVTGAANGKHREIDRIVLGRFSGPFLMLLVLFCLFWLTIKGANYPSTLLQILFDSVYEWLIGVSCNWPVWISGLLVNGIYKTVSCVISVMLPPLLIFFPLFSILEDLGYLPRAAFLMDHSFEKCGSCGKQALTMAMGFGCNAVGVSGTRIIHSDKERVLAIITNALIPCNGRFPAMILLIRLFFTDNSLLDTVILMIFVCIGVGATLLSSKLIGDMMFRKECSQMILELPKYRKPSLRKITKEALFDHVIKVLSRAILVSVPAGALIWVLQYTGLLEKLIIWIDPLGNIMGMNGVILTAFVLSFPANELLLPLVLMILGNGVQMSSDPVIIQSVLVSGGWTIKTAVCVIVFLLFHWPCGTTCLTIWKETRSVRWIITAILMPLLLGVCLCSIIGNIAV